MKINISGLSEGSHQYDLVATASELGFELNFIGNVTANITLEKSIHQIVAMVNASVKGVFICDRCANEFTDDVKTSFTSVYSWEQTEETEEDDDFRVLRSDENIIDLSSAVKEYLLLAVPIKLLCRNNCEIPRSISIQEETVDPRWEKLKKLKQTEKN
ncbi:MAG: DUF177 domain-containing protein [Bacteroidota bacterium]